jgi:hypothetical protein
VSGMTKKGSGNITVSRKIGLDITPGGTPPPKGNGHPGFNYITVDRTVKMPPTRKPAK